MTNLLQENKEIESHRTNCTFVFLPTHRQTLKKPKEQFFQRSKIECIFEIYELTKELNKIYV